MQLPTKSKYPKELVIGDAIYKVKFVRKIAGEAGKLGECDPCDHVIRIKLGQSLTETFNTFLHEVLHAIEFEYEIRVSHKAIYLFEKGLSDFLMTNL